MTHAEAAYRSLIDEVREISLLGSVASVLGWDERTLMPERGTPYRAQQLALLARLRHERFTSRHIGDWLDHVEASGPTGDAAANVRQIRRSYDRAVKVPAALVVDQTTTAVMAQQAWAEARRTSDFAMFAPWLVRTLDLKRQEIDCAGYQDHPYDALLDEYEPGATTAELHGVFDALRNPLVDLIGRIGDAPRPAPVEILERLYPTEGQARVARAAAAAVGFDFDAGRLDVSLHPFCSGIGPGDTRMTTRYDERYFGDAFFGVLHETGHGLYEQGLLPEHVGTPLAHSVSLGIHESQSRMWENLVGRSRAFWTFFLPRVRAEFPTALAGVSDEDWYRAVNDVSPSFIRTEADEATYNLHVLLRFELELALVSGDLSVADLPGAWNERMKAYFGITPPDDARGVLQDIHWSGGAIGYFPTYTLGNLYAAQFFETAGATLGDLNQQFAAGDFAPLLGWLRTNIHNHGQRYTAGELVQRVTGKPLSAKPLLKHLRAKAADVYGV